MRHPLPPRAPYPILDGRWLTSKSGSRFLILIYALIGSVCLSGSLITDTYCCCKSYFRPGVFLQSMSAGFQLNPGKMFAEFVAILWGGSRHGHREKVTRGVCCADGGHYNCCGWHGLWWVSCIGSPRRYSPLQPPKESQVNDSKLHTIMIEEMHQPWSGLIFCISIQFSKHPRNFAKGRLWSLHLSCWTSQRRNWAHACPIKSMRVAGLGNWSCKISRTLNQQLPPWKLVLLERNVVISKFAGSRVPSWLSLRHWHPNFWRLRRFWTVQVPWSKLTTRPTTLMEISWQVTGADGICLTPQLSNIYYFELLNNNRSCDSVRL